MGKRKIILHDGRIIEDIQIINPKNAHDLFLAADNE
jgi:ABC-type uncharacterized transport system ATPase component